ncbi:hypothetical protein KAR91_36985 [Candidatus Pacearchaeota archaeon]|nr:hypothetical protein [Candidatus Pacearchaeota archaeon]
MIHTTVGVYSDGSYKANGVKSEALAYHIWYNINFRPGRVFIVDGHCLHRAGLSQAESDKIVKKFEHIEYKMDTAPYV